VVLVVLLFWRGDIAGRALIATLGWMVVKLEGKGRSRDRCREHLLTSRIRGRSRSRQDRDRAIALQA
jgi:hypothetical protein